MRKIYAFTLLFALFSLSAKAQNGKIFPDSVALWTEFTNHREDPEDQTYIDNTYFMYGDTVINGMNYKNLYIISSVFKENNHGSITDNRFVSGLNKKIGALRKENKKLIARFFTTNVPFSVSINHDYMLFDMAWKKGDTLFSEKYGSSNPDAYLLFDDVLTTADGLRLMFPNTDLASSTDNYLMEGIGFRRSVFFRLFDFTYKNPGDVKVATLTQEQRIDGFCGDDDLAGYTPGAIPANDCQKQFSKAMSAPQVNKLNISVYPNPVTDFLRIDDINENAEIKITDILGKGIKVNTTLSNSTASLDCAVLPAGMYVLTVSTENGVFSEKIVKR